MKWPFVRTSFHDNIVSKLINREFRLGEENDRLNNVIANMEALKNEYAQLNHDNLNEINRLNKELASELNSHRETKEQKNELSAECDRLYDEVDNLKNELKETKRYNENILNEAKMQYEILESSQQLNCDLKKELRETKDALKIAIDDLKNAALCIGEQKTQLEIWKKRSNFYSNNCTEAKESISKVRGHLKTIAKKL